MIKSIATDAGQRISGHDPPFRPTDGEPPQAATGSLTGALSRNIHSRL
jgi:hypothetical protein